MTKLKYPIRVGTSSAGVRYIAYPDRHTLSDVAAMIARLEDSGGEVERRARTLVARLDRPVRTKRAKARVPSDLYEDETGLDAPMEVQVAYTPNGVASAVIQRVQPSERMLELLEDPKSRVAYPEQMRVTFSYYQGDRKGRAAGHFQQFVVPEKGRGSDITAMWKGFVQNLGGVDTGPYSAGDLSKTWYAYGEDDALKAFQVISLKKKPVTVLELFWDTATGRLDVIREDPDAFGEYNFEPFLWWEAKNLVDFLEMATEVREDEARANAKRYREEYDPGELDRLTKDALKHSVKMIKKWNRSRSAKEPWELS